MSRTLEIETLQNFGSYLAAEWLKGAADGFTAQTARRIERAKKTGETVTNKRLGSGRGFVRQELFNLHFKDEFEVVVDAIRDNLGPKAMADLEAVLKDLPERKEDEFVKQLRERLAIDPNGNHIEGCIGKVQVGVRPVLKIMFEAETRESIRRRKEKGLPLHAADRDDRETYQRLGILKWPVYAGEVEERRAGRVSPIGQPGADELPEGAIPTMDDGRLAAGLGANVPTFSAEVCTLALDAVADNLDEGSTAATIRGRTGAQPADPDAAETGTLLFTLTMSDPAFGAAVDDADGTCSVSASAITDDSSADATNTLSYCRAGATGTGADDHIDGEAGTSSADFIFNTLAIVSGATVSMSSFVINLSQGSTAT